CSMPKPTTGSRRNRPHHSRDHHHRQPKLPPSSPTTGAVATLVAHYYRRSVATIEGRRRSERKPLSTMTMTARWRRHGISEPDDDHGRRGHGSARRRRRIPKMEEAW
ncbi:hypothetical protein Dimus_018234, partial [Dionaea muscipula]